MAQTLSGQGWLGIAPTGQKITLRSLDFGGLKMALFVKTGCWSIFWMSGHKQV